VRELFAQIDPQKVLHFSQGTLLHFLNGQNVLEGNLPFFGYRFRFGA
jgi:hypothetical protein